MFASRRPVYPAFLGGAERSFYELARALNEAGHSVVMVGEFAASLGHPNDFFSILEPDHLDWDIEWTDILGQPVPRHMRLVIAIKNNFSVVHTLMPDFQKLFGDVLEGFRPDLICTQLDGSPDVVQRCLLDQLPVMHFVRDTFHPTNFHILREPSEAQRPTACVANSEYVASFLRANIGIESHVLYPIVRVSHTPSERTTARSRPRVMFANPVPYKGGDVIFDVATRMTDTEFVLLPGWGIGIGGRWTELANVEIHSWPIARMEEVYLSCDLVVVPTQESEAFGRIAIEAQSLGIPVIASRHSGLCEILGDSGFLIDDYRNPNAWSDAIRQLLASPSQRTELTITGRTNAARFSGRSAVTTFERIVAGLRSERASG